MACTWPVGTSLPEVTANSSTLVIWAHPKNVHMTMRMAIIFHLINPEPPAGFGTGLGTGLGCGGTVGAVGVTCSACFGVSRGGGTSFCFGFRNRGGKSFGFFDSGFNSGFGTDFGTA